MQSITKRKVTTNAFRQSEFVPILQEQSYCHGMSNLGMERNTVAALDRFLLLLSIQIYVGILLVWILVGWRRHGLAECYEAV